MRGPAGHEATSYQNAPHSILSRFRQPRNTYLRGLRRASERLPVNPYDSDDDDEEEEEEDDDELESPDRHLSRGMREVLTNIRSVESLLRRASDRREQVADVAARAFLAAQGVETSEEARGGRRASGGQGAGGSEDAGDAGGGGGSTSTITSAVV